MRVLLCVLCFAFCASANSNRICDFSPLPAGLKKEGFRHRRNRVASAFEVRHSANDVIAVFGKDALLKAKFSYGLAGKDLTDETVEVWLDSCLGNYQLIHRGTTDRDGRLVWALPTAILEQPGEYNIWIRVVGDGSGALSKLRAVDKGTKVAVFDIDGTLTSSEDDIRWEVISEIIGGNYFPPKRESSTELSNFLHDQLGYEIVYLSGRHYFLSDLTRTWLARNDFAPGSLMTTQSYTEIFPWHGSVGNFKLSELKRLAASDLQVVRAYGNTKTDFHVYKEAGLPLDHIFIIGRLSGLLGSKGLGNSFTQHYQELLSGGNV